MVDQRIEVATPPGPGALLVSAPATSAPGEITLLLGHGAGGQLDAVDLAALAAELPAHGIRVIRFEQPWRTAGRKVAAPAARLDEAWLAAAAEVTRRWPGRLITGGRSSGARVACRTASSTGAAGVVCLAFPLHPPGRPAKTRLPELLTPTVPVLVCQGTRDTFGDAAAVRQQIKGHDTIEVTVIGGADHGMKVRRSDALDAPGVRSMIVSTVVDFIGRLGAQHRPPVESPIGGG
ncbi:MAG: hydrolase [Propionibacteriales bacterium]|nr:hydrolase [Propionibacteriales bacterium]